MASTIFGSDGATATSTRPQGFAGRLALVLSVSSVQVFAPSCDSKRPLPLGASGPSPPARDVQPLRRESHMPAKRWSGFFGSTAREAHPVERFAPLSASDQVLPPSAVL